MGYISTDDFFTCSPAENAAHVYQEDDMRTEYEFQERDRQFERSQGDRVESYGPLMISLPEGEYHARMNEVARLTIELAEAKDEIARLKQHVKDITADLDSAVEECNRHCTGEGIL